MKKMLVTYFSASQVTKKVAEKLSKTLNADLFEICPETLYSNADLDWTNKQSRSTLEMKDLSCRPAIKGKVECIEQYDVIFVGFPIWWGREPSVIDTFLTSYNLQNHYIVPFATSGGSPMGQTSKRIAELTNASVNEGKILSYHISENELKKWIKQLNL